jgi:hypothetical protein
MLIVVAEERRERTAHTEQIESEKWPERGKQTARANDENLFSLFSGAFFFPASFQVFYS